MNVRVVLGALAVPVLITACRTPDPSAVTPELSLEPPVSAVEQSTHDADCARLVNDIDLATVDGRHRAVIVTVDAIRAGRCGSIAADDRVCRALFLIGATDPLVGVGLGLGDATLGELADGHRWALGEGVAAAEANGNADLAGALRELKHLDVGVALAAGPAALASAAVERAATSIIEPIAAAEARCSCRIGRALVLGDVSFTC